MADWQGSGPMARDLPKRNKKELEESSKAKLGGMRPRLWCVVVGEAWEAVSVVGSGCQ